MKILITIILLLIIIYLLDKLCLWLEKKGLLFYRHKKSQTSFLGATMQELQSYLNPSTKHTIEAKQKVGKFKRAEEDNPSDKAN